MKIQPCLKLIGQMYILNVFERKLKTIQRVISLPILAAYTSCRQNEIGLQWADHMEPVSHSLELWDRNVRPSNFT